MKLKNIPNIRELYNDYDNVDDDYNFYNDLEERIRCFSDSCVLYSVNTIINQLSIEAGSVGSLAIFLCEDTYIKRNLEDCFDDLIETKACDCEIGFDDFKEKWAQHLEKIAKKIRESKG